MNVVVHRDELFKGLRMVQDIVEPTPTLPILATILLWAEDGTLGLRATNLEATARVSVPARVPASGALALAADRLIEVVRKLPSAPVTLQGAKDNGVTIRCAGVQYRMVGLAANEFPAMPPESPRSWLTLKSTMLRAMLAETRFAISRDETRPALNGILFLLQPQHLRLVATDGHRLAISVRPVDGGPSGMSGIVPREVVATIMRALEAGEDVQIALTDNQFVLQMPNGMMTTRLIEGQFPNYEAVMPRQHLGRLAVRRNPFMYALRQVAVMAERPTMPVRISVGPENTMTVSAASQDRGEAETVLDVAYTGPTMTTGFNARYLLDALDPIEQEDVVVELKDPLSPGVIRGQQDDGYACLVMPIRLGL